MLTEERRTEGELWGPRQICTDMYGHAHVRSGLLGRARSGPSRLTLNSYFALKKFWIMASHYIGRLLDELARPNGKLDNLKEKLRFGRTEKVSFTQNPLGRYVGQGFSLIVYIL